MNAQDFSTYRIDDFCNYMWLSNGYSQVDIDRLPLGSQYHALYAPAINLKAWTLVLYEIRMMPYVYKPGKYRAHVVMERVVLPEAVFDWEPIVIPYELPKAEQVDNSEAWLEYIETGKVSGEVAKVLPTLGSYEGMEQAA